MGALAMSKWREAKNRNNDCTYILFDGIFTGRYRVTTWGFNIKVGENVTYKAQQIGDQIWLSVQPRHTSLSLLKRIPCGVEPLSNEEIYQIAVKYI